MRRPDPRGLIDSLMRYAPACVESTWRKPPGVGDRASRAVAIALSALVIAGVVVPAFAAGTAAGADGFVGVPDANVHEDLPAGADVGVSVSDLRGSTMTTRHASTLEVTLTTPSRASEYIDNSSAVLGGDSDGLALVISDATNHEGREVALPLTAVKGALGYVPDLVHGVHDDGTTWTRPVHEESGLLVFEVPHFSDNAVTFESSVSVAASPATNGTSLSWGLSDLDAASDVSVNLTGTVSTEQEMPSVSDFTSTTWDPQITGDLQPTGPGGGEPELTVAPNSVLTDSWNASSGDAVRTTGNYAGVKNGSIYIREQNSGDGSGNRWDVDWEVFRYADGKVLETGTVTLTDANSFTDSVVADVTGGYGFNDSKVGVRLTSNTGAADIYTGGGDTFLNAYPVVSVTAAGTTEYPTFTSGTNTSQWDLAVGETIDVSSPTGVDLTLNVTERTATTNPGVELSNCTESYPGTLPDGETATLTLNTSCLSETNELNVSVGGDLSADAPAPQVAVVAEHTAASNQTVDYAGDSWSERYNVSKTWADSRSDASLVIPFATNVVSIRDVEVRTDSSSWTGTSNYELDGTTLTVNLGSVDAGETTHVRVNGSRVRVENGSITVTNPTVAGNTLDTEFRIDSWSESSYIAVGGSDEGEFVHYLVSESWTSPSESVVVEADGSQRIYAPKAPEGGTARARTIAVEVQPENDVRVSVADPTQPTFEVRPAGTTGDAYDVVYHDTVSGDTYRLVSETRDGFVIDEATASSPVTFTDSEDDTELLSIVKVNETSGSAGSGGGGGGGGGAAPASVSNPTGPLSSPLVVGPLGVALVLGAFIVSRRTRIPIWATAPASGIAFVVVLESLAPGTVSGVVRRLGVEVASGIGQVSSALVLAGGAVALWGVYRVVKRFTSKDRVALTIPGRSR